GSGTSVQDVNKLLKQHQEMSRMVKQVSKLGQKGLMRHGLSALRPGGFKTCVTDQEREDRCPSKFDWRVAAPRSGRSIVSSSLIRAARAMAVSSNASAATTRWSRKIIQPGPSSNKSRGSTCAWVA